MTKVINLIGAPSVGKSVLMAMIFIELKKRNLKCEMVQEWVKNIIWQNELETVKNQHYIIQQQYKSIKCLVNKVDYIVLDTSLVNYMYYNKTYSENICNVEKTEKYAKELLEEFDNIYIFVKRNHSFVFEKEGRIHTYEESLKIEKEMENLIDELNLESIKIQATSDEKYISELVNKFL